MACSCVLATEATLRQYAGLGKNVAFDDPSVQIGIDRAYAHYVEPLIGATCFSELCTRWATKDDSPSLATAADYELVSRLDRLTSYAFAIEYRKAAVLEQTPAGPQYKLRGNADAAELARARAQELESFQADYDRASSAFLTWYRDNAADYPCQTGITPCDSPTSLTVVLNRTAGETPNLGFNSTLTRGTAY
jgi:hypothetical protein